MTTVFRIEKAKYANLWPSKGSLYGTGRWNRKGNLIVYTSASISLAKLEILANTASLPKNRVLFKIQIRDDVNIYTLEEKGLPENWNSVSYTEDNWKIIDSLIDDGIDCIQVPSMITPTEHNYLLNGSTEDFKRKFKRTVTKLYFDSRLRS
jgi:RES domain-containing protein